MTIHNAEFHKSVSDLGQLPDPGPSEVVFVGRSNVGKSTLLNTLTGRRSLAKTSSTPGKTQLINYFSINDGQCWFVDLPGYGYAKVAKGQRYEWGRLLGGYIRKREEIALVVLLIDARHPEMESDRQMMEFLDFYHRPYAVVLTKFDKLRQKEKAYAVKELKSSALKANFIVNYSAISGAGRDKLLEHLAIYTG